jgi:FAD/FMN-containing dehydrogenase
MSTARTASVEIATLEGGRRLVAREALEQLDREIEGTVSLPGDPAYQEATLIWNAAVSKQPAVVVRPASAQDVARVLAFVREDGLELSVRGGGHNIAGLGLSDGGVTLDMALLRSVDVDDRMASVGAGCTLGDVDRSTHQHGLATTLGFVSGTGVAGLTLGGGFGYLSRQFGWTVDDLEQIDLVTADGRIVRASRSEHDDLFWAIRGGGGNFGVVTDFVSASTMWDPT